MKRLPWLSFTLLLASYSCFSWFLYGRTTPIIVWAGLVTFALGQALLLTTLFQGCRKVARGWLQSDLGYFSMVLLGALSLVFVLVWTHIAEYVIVVVGAEILSRLDLQNLGFNDWQALSILTSVSLLGLIVGWLVRYSLMAGGSSLVL